MSYQQKCTLETLISGACWSDGRIKSESNQDYDALCKVCKVSDADDLHTYWTCSSLSESTNVCISTTQHLVSDAIVCAEAEQCLYFRGILPRRYTKVPDEFAPKSDVDYNIVFVGEYTGGFGSGIYYGDASGGPDTQFSTLRRVGCAFILVCDDVHVGTASFNLPGDIQTVFRGGLFVLLTLVRMCEEDSDIVFITDTSPNHDLYHNPDSALRSLSADLFLLAFRKSL